MNEKLKSAVGVILVVVVFIAMSYFVKNNSELFEIFIQNDSFSMAAYVLILIFSAVFAPIDMVFLMPVAASVWGVSAAALLSLLGWTLGSALVFVLSRRYGVPLIKKLIPMNKIYQYEKLMPQKNLFVGIIFLRLAIPVDIVSYAVGLFTKIRFVPYFIATFIGFMPLAFFLAYLGTLPTYVQIIGLVVVLIVGILGFLSVRPRRAKK